jgi:hypothetical protein
MSMPIRRTTKKESGQRRYASAVRHKPELHPTSTSSLLAEDRTFLAAWRNGLVPCPGAFLREVRHSNAGFIAVLHGGAVAEKSASGYPHQANPNTQPEVRDQGDDEGKTRKRTGGRHRQPLDSIVRR